MDDEAVRREIQDGLIAQSEISAAERGDTVEARVLAAARDAFVGPNRGQVSIREITDRFNASREEDFASPASNKWIGYIVRTRLRLTTRKSNGVFVVPASELQKIETLAARYGLAASI